MHSCESPYSRCACAASLALAMLGGCASHHRPAPQFTADAPFSRTFNGSGDEVCWSVKRALLSQGYMLDRPNDGSVFTGSRDEQPSPKLNVTIRLQTTCADNRNGTSIVFVTASREENALQKMKQTTSVGVGPATLTMPSGSARVLGTVRRETVKDPNFYNDFFNLIQNYVNQEKGSNRPAATRRPAHLSSEPVQDSQTESESGPSREVQNAPSNPNQ